MAMGSPRIIRRRRNGSRKLSNKENGGLNPIWAICYKNGYGVPKDRTEAIKWYKQAAHKGNEYAKKELQKMGVAPK